MPGVTEVADLTDPQVTALRQALATSDGTDDLLLTDLRVSRALVVKGVLREMPRYCVYRLTDLGLATCRSLGLLR